MPQLTKDTWASDTKYNVNYFKYKFKNACSRVSSLIRVHVTVLLAILWPCGFPSRFSSFLPPPKIMHVRGLIMLNSLKV